MADETRVGRPHINEEHGVAKTTQFIEGRKMQPLMISEAFKLPAATLKNLERKSANNERR